MIRLIKIDGSEILFNDELIKSIDEGELTTITLVTGEELKVKNSKKDILTKIRASKIGKKEDDRAIREYENQLKKS